MKQARQTRQQRQQLPESVCTNVGSHIHMDGTNALQETLYATGVAKEVTLKPYAKAGVDVTVIPDTHYCPHMNGPKQSPQRVLTGAGQRQFKGRVSKNGADVDHDIFVVKGLCKPLLNPQLLRHWRSYHLSHQSHLPI